MKKKQLLPIFAVALALPAAVFAQSDYEGFDFAGPAVAGNGSGTGWFAGSTWNATAGDLQIGVGSLAFGSLETSGNRVVANGDTTHIHSRRMAANAPSSGDFWVSVIVDTQGFDTAGVTFSNNATGNLHLTAGDFGNRARFGFGISGTNFVYRLDGRDGTPINGSVAGATGDATLLVAHFDVTAGDFSLWANPTIGGSAPTGGTLVADAVGFTRSGATFAGDVSYAGLFADRIGTQLDELRIGSSFGEVSPIPEPSAFAALLGFVALGLVASRRRQAKLS